MTPTHKPWVTWRFKVSKVYFLIKILMTTWISFASLFQFGLHPSYVIRWLWLVFHHFSINLYLIKMMIWALSQENLGERGGSVVECRTPEREVRGSRPTSAVLCPWARHFTPRKYWLITQEAMAPSRHDWKVVDWDVKPQHNQPTNKKTCLQSLQPG